MKCKNCGHGREWHSKNQRRYKGQKKRTWICFHKSDKRKGCFCSCKKFEMKKEEEND